MKIDDNFLVESRDKAIALVILTSDGFWCSGIIKSYDDNCILISDVLVYRQYITAMYDPSKIGVEKDIKKFSRKIYFEGGGKGR